MTRLTFLACLLSSTIGLAGLAGAGVALGGCSGSSTHPPAGATSDAGDGDANANANANANADGATAADAAAGADAAASSDASTSADAKADAAPLTPAEKALCDALASRAMCPVGAASNCSEEKKCLYARITEPGVAEAYAACHGYPSCKGDDGCLAAAGEAVGGQAARDYVTSCQAKVAECGALLLDDELCTTAAYAFKGLGAGAAVCLTKPCADQKACFAALLGPIQACEAL